MRHLLAISALTLLMGSPAHAGGDPLKVPISTLPAKITPALADLFHIVGVAEDDETLVMADPATTLLRPDNGPVFPGWRPASFNRFPDLNTINSLFQTTP